MTSTTAQTVISALIAAGYSVKANNIGLEWTVIAEGADINVIDVSNFAASQGVNGFISSAKFK